MITPYGTAQLQRYGRPLGLPGAVEVYMEDVTAANKLASDAKHQVDLAKQGARLDSHTQAPSNYQTASDIPGAYLVAAYWLGVASRVSGSAKLADAASSHYTRGRWLAAIPFASATSELITNVPEQIQGILRGAASEVQKWGDSQAWPVSEILLGQSRTDTVATKRQAAYERSPAGTVVAPLITTGQELAALTYDPWSTLRQLPWWGWMFVGLGVLAVASPFLAPLVASRMRAHRS